MEEILVQNAQAYASQHELQLAERLGFGIHGIIFVAEDKSKAGKTALKVHRSAEPYHCFTFTEKLTLPLPRGPS